MKKLLIVLSSILLLLPLHHLNGCGYYLDESQYRVFLLQPDIVNTRELGAFYYTPDYINYQAAIHTDEPAKEANCKEWKNHCHYSGSWKEIYKIMYELSANEFLNLPDSSINKIPFLKHLSKKYEKEYDYLRYSRQCERVLNAVDPWTIGTGPKQGADTIMLWYSLKTGNDLYKKADNDFLKMRIAYQFIKLNYYHPTIGESSNAVFKKFIEPLHTNSWIKESARFYCIQPTYDAKFDYKLSISFDRSIDKRSRCVELFSRKHLNKTLAYAKNDHEKAVIYTMYELQNPARSLPALEKIYALDPGNKDLALLISRELNKIEDWLLTPELTNELPAIYYWRDYENAYKNQSSDKRYLNSVYSFISKIISGNKQSNGALWNLLSAHTALLLNKKEEAKNQLDTAGKIATDPKIKFQIELDRLLLQFNGKTKLNAELEKQILDFQNYAQKHEDLFLQQETIINQAWLFIGNKLNHADDVAHGVFFLSKTNMSLGMLGYWVEKNFYVSMLETAKPSDYDEAIALLEKKNKTKFEKFLTTRKVYDTKYWWDDPARIRDSTPLSTNKLLDYKSMYFVQHNMLDSALQCVSKIPEEYWKEKPYDLFQCFPFRAPFGTDYQSNNDFYVYNKRMYLQRMCDLKSLIEKNQGDIARHHFVLATGYFNMTYHGNFWIMNLPYKYNEELEQGFYATTSACKEFADNYYGCKLAEYHYLEAMKLTKDSTFAVLCAARAGSCNINKQELEWYRTSTYNWKTYSWSKDFEPVYGKYKKRFEKRFGKSDYYDDFVSSCYHFEHLNNKFF